MDKDTINPREWLGRKIREYHLTEIIGSGGMSAVFRGNHTRLQIDRAVKVLRPNLATDPQFVRRFEQEARILAVLEHQNLIRVFEFFEENGFLFIVMELAEGESLEDLVLYHGVIPAREMWIILSQAAQGLAYAHSKGITHRDLSPDNIMVAGFEEQKIRVKVIDFGIARQDAFDPESKKIMETGTTTTGSFLGKLRYCSPEQAMEMPVDHRSDQYSLALIFLESVTGKPAFEGGSPVTMLMRRVNEPPPRLTDLTPGSSWPSEVDRVLDQALQSGPAERYPDIVDFAEALGDALGLEASDAKPETFIDRRKKKETTIRLLEPEDEGESEIVLSVSSLADAMETRPNRTITPGTSPVKSEPLYGRVQAPPPRKRFPWIKISLALIISGMIAGYFLLPQELATEVNSKAVQIIDQAKIKTMEIIAGPPTSTPTPVTKKKSSRPRKRKATTNVKEPYWMERTGVVKPVVNNTTGMKLPAYLKSEFEPPIEVIVQAVVLKNGKVGRVAVLNSVHSDLDKLAMDAVNSWSFKPGTYQGKKADIIMDIPIVFK